AMGLGDDLGCDRTKDEAGHAPARGADDDMVEAVLVGVVDDGRSRVAGYQLDGLDGWYSPAPGRRLRRFQNGVKLLVVPERMAATPSFRDQDVHGDQGKWCLELSRQVGGQLDGGAGMIRPVGCTENLHRSKPPSGGGSKAAAMNAS